MYVVYNLVMYFILHLKYLKDLKEDIASLGGGVIVGLHMSCSIVVLVYSIYMEHI